MEYNTCLLEFHRLGQAEVVTGKEVDPNYNMELFEGSPEYSQITEAINSA